MSEYCMKCMEPLHSERKCPHCGFEGTSSVAPHCLQPGTVLNERYLIGVVIGQGGFGITYMGRDLKLDMRVAVKEYYPNGYTNRNAEVSSRLTISDKKQEAFIRAGKIKFLEEARALAQLHENAGVVDVRDFFEANQTAYIVMEYLDGEDLRKTLRHTNFSANEVFRIMRPVMDALEKVHDVGIIHRDISPDNIMLLKNGSVKLMDFGASKTLDFSDQRSVSVVLKAGYAPEEQYRPKGVLGPWTDIYALCATIYKCVTGITPDDALERGHKDSLQWPSELGIEITKVQESVLKKGMAVEIQDRFQSIRELKAMLYESKAELPEIELETDSDEKTEYFERKEPTEESEDKAEDKEKDKEKDKAEDKAENKTADRKGMFAGIGVLAVVLAAGAAVLVGGRKTVPLETDASETTSAVVWENTEVSLADRYPLADYIHLILQAGEGISVKGYQSAVETLRERLEIFSGDQDFGMEVVEDKVDLYLPKSEVGDYDISYLLKCYLTRAIKLYAFHNENVGYNPEKFAIGREDLEEVTMSEGAIEGVNAKDYNIDTDTYPYIKVVLTDACAEKYKEEITAWGETLCFGQDMSVDNWYYYYTFPAGDGKTFYLLNNNLAGSCVDLTYYNLTHEPLEQSFLFWIDFSYRASWETVDEAEFVGVNQCNMEELNGKTVTAFYTHYAAYSEKLSQGECLDTKQILKERLDSLEVPYAFGWEEQDGKQAAVVKIGLEHIGYPILDTLGSRYGVSLQSELIKKSISSSDHPTFSYEKNTDGTYQLRLQMKASNQSQSLSEILDGAWEEAQEVFLKVNNRPFLSAQMTQEMEQNELIFDSVYFPEKTPITDENLWIAKYVEALVCGSDLPQLLSCYDGDLFIISDDPRDMDALDMGVNYSGLEDQWERMLSEKEENVDVSITNSTVKVFYHLEVNEELPREMLRLGKETYETLEFEKGGFDSLYLYFIDENDEKKERARVNFVKICNEKSTDQSTGYIYVQGRFANGRLERYIETFQKLKDEDLFYQKLEDAYPYDEELWNYE